MSEFGPTVFRGATLDEVLPKIRAELGPDAIILAEREGVVGGIGGFFARQVRRGRGVPRAAPPPEPGDAEPRHERPRARRDERTCASRAPTHRRRRTLDSVPSRRPS